MSIQDHDNDNGGCGLSAMLLEQSEVLYASGDHGGALRTISQIVKCANRGGCNMSMACMRNCRATATAGRDAAGLRGVELRVVSAKTSIKDVNEAICRLWSRGAMPTVYVKPAEGGKPPRIIWGGCDYKL